MERSEFNSAIQRLALLDRATAGKEAFAFATRLLPTAAKYNTPADQAALWSLAIAVYFSAVAYPGQRNAATVSALIEDRYVRLCRHAADDDIFGGLVDYPEPLDEMLRGLSRLPRPLVIAGLESLRRSLNYELPDLAVT